MKVSLSPFPGCVQAVLPIPQVFALIHCVVARVCIHFPILPDGNVPVNVFVDVDGVEVKDLAAHLGQHKQALIDETRRLLITPTSLN